ncbi:MAG TPA: type II toxin-antitoxin system HicB family antitoxin [Bryobacteraceae bacterium]|nr:type II toxin-antitoxin system HicB family antitoxin [Bryobacteraceae bacterium]
MIAEYLNAALKHARYDIIEDAEPFYGEIPECSGVWASGKTLEECRQNLLEGLEGWIILGLQRGSKIPAIDGISLTAGETAPVSG